MFKINKLLAVGVAVLSLSALSVTVFAASTYSSTAEAVADLTDRTVESVVEERQDTGNTYCTIASEAGVLEEYQSAMLEIRKDSLDARVASGDMTQEQADEILATIETNMENCDGTGSAKIGQSNGAGFGSNGNCLGTGTGTGFHGQGSQSGQGGRGGHGVRLQDGTCGN